MSTSPEGYKEVVLTGTQLGSYGFDLAGVDLVGLLERILSETQVTRLRVSSLQPQEIDARLLALWTDSRLCPHFHLALQSGSDEVLKRMRRRYTVGRYVEAVEMIRAGRAGRVRSPPTSSSAFPAKRTRTSQRTYGLCDQGGVCRDARLPLLGPAWDQRGPFWWRCAPGGQVEPASVISSGCRDANPAAFRERLLGTTRPVLWEALRESMGPDVWVGLTDNYVRVAARSPRILTNELTSGAPLHNVKRTWSSPRSSRGPPLRRPPEGPLTFLALPGDAPRCEVKTASDLS